MKSVVALLLLAGGCMAVYQTATGNGAGTPGGAVGKVQPIFGGPSVCPTTFPEGAGIAPLPSACAEPVPGTPRADPGAEVPADVPEVCGSTGMDAVLATIRQLESGDRYEIGANKGGASGAYQFIKSTWDATARRAGRPDLTRVWPYQASRADQDALARQLVAEALGGTQDVARIPVVWYYPKALEQPALMDVVPAPEAGNTKTPRQYRAIWLGIYRQHGGTCA
jgi:hypothetical protein